MLTYVAEVTQPNLRGILASASTMTVSMGFLLQFLLGTFFEWRQVALINMFFPALCLFFLCFIPETPNWLLSKDRLDDAKKSLAWLRGWTKTENVQKEFDELHEKIKEEQEQKAKENNETLCQSWNFVLKKDIYWPMALVSFTFFVAQFNGNTILTTYAIVIFSTLKIPIDEYYATIILGIVQLFGSLFCVSLIYSLGKRILTFISLFGSGISFFIVAVYIYFNNILYLDQGEPDQDTAKHLTPVIFLVFSALLSFVGIALLPWTLVGEVFPDEYRAKASGLVSAFGYIVGFTANKIFLVTVKTLTLPGVFLLFSLINIIGLIILYFTLPETEGKSLHEISDHFKGVKKIDNLVKRTRRKEEEKTYC